MLARLFTISIFIFLFILTPVVYAAGLNVTYIGSLATNGSKYSEWWYTGTNPVIKGVAGSNDSVKITLNGFSQDLTADSEGSWSYASTLVYGDHDVKVESAGESYSFKLHLTQTLPETFGSTTTVETSQSSQIPDTGSNTLIAATLSTVLLISGVFYFKSTQTKQKIEDTIRNSA